MKISHVPDAAVNLRPEPKTKPRVEPDPKEAILSAPWAGEGVAGMLLELISWDNPSHPFAWPPAHRIEPGAPKRLLPQGCTQHSRPLVHGNYFGHFQATHAYDAVVGGRQDMILQRLHPQLDGHVLDLVQHEQTVGGGLDCECRPWTAHPSLLQWPSTSGRTAPRPQVL